MAKKNDFEAGTKFYRTAIAGLNIITGDPADGEVAPESVRFDAFEERVRGDKVVVGYLATANQTAIRKLAKDPNVENIDEKEYVDATDEENEKVKRASI